MRTKSRIWVPARLLLSVISLISITAIESAQLVTTPDPSSHPAPGGNGESSLPLVTPDGRFVLFASAAENLVSAISNAPLSAPPLQELNVYIADRSNHITTLVSQNVSGQSGGNGPSLPAGISTNGRYVLFETSASDLLGGDTNAASDVLVRDLLLGTNILISVATNGSPANGDSHGAVMTPDGRFVAFVSAANNLVPGDTNNIPDVFLRDILTGVTTLASVGAFGTSASSQAPELTPDGRYVAFSSSATNLVPGVPAGTDIYVRDLVASTTIWASSFARTALYSLPNASNAVCFSHRISADGRFIAYETSPAPVNSQNWPTNCIVLRYDVQTGLTDVISTNGAMLAGPPEDIKTLAMTPDGRFIAYTANPNSTPGRAAAIYLWDSFSNSSALVSADLAGAVSSNALSLWPSISPDGRFIAFQSAATNLVTNSLAGEFHLYVRDMRAQVTTLVDVNTNGVGSGVTALTMPQLSDDARFVTFEAADGTLIPGYSNPSADVFVRDLATASTELISNHDPSLRSRTPNGPSSLSPLSVSAEGSFVVFASDASDLVLNDTNGYRDVFVRDLLADSTLLVTVDLSAAASGNGASAEPVISADGRYVAFTSTATNLVAADNNRASDVFVRDLLTGTTDLVSVNTNGLTGNHASYAPTITADGRAVLFHSLASDLVPGSFGSSVENIFWRDLSSATTYALTSFNLPFPISLLPSALTPDGHFVVFGSQQTNWYIWDSQLHSTVYTNFILTGGRMNIVAVSPDANRIAYGSGTNLYLVDRSAGTTNLLGALRSNLMGGGFAHVDPRFSADGRYLTYVTTSGTVPADTNGLYHVYLYDWQTFSNVLVSQPYNAPASADGDSDSPDISPDGRFVVYRSAASNLVPGDANGVPDIFLWDRLSGATMLLSISHASNSTADNRSLTPVFSRDGSTILFESWASDIVPPDFNRGNDLFAINLLSSGPIPLFRVAIVLGSGSGVWLTWPAIFGKSYTVQFKNSLADPAWQELPGNVTFVGAKAYLNDLAPAAGQRFYRVLAN